MEAEHLIVPSEDLSYSEGARRLSGDRLTERNNRAQPFPASWSLPSPNQLVPLVEGPTRQNQDGGILPDANIDTGPRLYSNRPSLQV